MMTLFFYVVIYFGIIVVYWLLNYYEKRGKLLTKESEMSR